MIEVMGAFAIVARDLVRRPFGAGRHAHTWRLSAPLSARCCSIYRPFKSLTRTNNNIQQGLAAAERVSR